MLFFDAGPCRTRRPGLHMCTARIASGSLPTVAAWVLAACAAAALPPARAQTAPAETAPQAAAPASVSRESASYSLGLSFASQWREGGLQGAVSVDDLIRGIRAGLSGSELTKEDRAQASALMHEAYQGWADRNRDAALKFLSSNTQAPGVKTTASGLQYLVLKPGDPAAAPASPMDHVTVQYRGHLLNGYEFDSTYARGKPAVIRPNDVISGWREALAMMPKGSEWRLFIPPELAYALTPPPSIPPGSLLIFDVEVLGVEHVASRAAPAKQPAKR